MEYSAIKEEPQLKHKPLIMSIDNKKSILASLTWIMPWAEKVSEDCYYIEIDGSYKAYEPYNYCIFYGIIYNNSLPFAVTLFPSEYSVYLICFLLVYKSIIFQSKTLKINQLFLI
ncbi:hypothetical protein M9Y10_019041 [Tritrichomonas musculus]|uniref:Uncharacterized protein n=1 Tax=Tritrichomonas musculus TaxID=1915356 RepID=A0ABR2HJJ6_9EUKA